MENTVVNVTVSNILLMETVCQCKAIYAKSCLDYKDRMIKKNAWQAIANALQSDGSAVRIDGSIGKVDEEDDSDGIVHTDNEMQLSIC